MTRRRRPAAFPLPAGAHDVVGVHLPGCARWQGQRCDCKQPGPDAPRGERVPASQPRLVAVPDEDTPDFDDEGDVA